MRLRRSDRTSGASVVDFIQIAISARLAHADLIAGDHDLEAGPNDPATRLILIKQLLVTCANVSDLEGISRALYQAHPELGDLITAHKRRFEFAKYIRNIFVGHVNPALCRKVIEWRPELNALLAEPEEGAGVFLGYAVLETAINTYVDGERHRIFESDTDLAYPPDMTRFLDFLGQTVHVGIAYCEALGTVAVREAKLPDFQKNLLDLARKAGQTDFKFITKKGEAS